MRPSFVGVSLMFALALGGCPETRRDAVVDMGATGRPDADSAADMNAPPPVDLGSADLGTADAGGPRTIASICSDACDALGTCFGMPAGPDCAMGCIPDLADCSPAQLDAIAACTMAGCAPEGDPPMPKIVACLQAVTCIDMGGGTPPPPTPAM